MRDYKIGDVYHVVDIPWRIDDTFIVITGFNVSDRDFDSYITYKNIQNGFKASFHEDSKYASLLVKEDSFLIEVLFRGD